jgi:site-specific DNA recombinase
MMDTVKKAVIYVRVSSPEQAAGDKASLEVQQRDCETYCRNKGYIIVRAPYVDIQTGTDTRKERVAYEQMLADAYKGDFDIVVAWRPDRLFRSLWPAARLKQMMDATGIDVETVTLPMDKTTLGLWAWVAEREIESIRERTMMGKESLARAGKMVTGNPPYGFEYDRVAKKVYHHEKETTLVLTMFEWVAGDKSINSLVAYLNRMGILTRQGNFWRRQEVLKILRNPIYAGRAYWGKRERRNGKVVRRKSYEQAIMIPVPPIVVEELFQKVQRQLDKNRVLSPRNTKHVFLLQNLLYCRVCGKSFKCRARSKSHGRSLKVPERYYGCRGMQNSPGAYNCRGSAEINANVLEKAVWDKVSEAFSQPETILEILKARNESAKQEAEAMRSELKAAEEQLTRKNLELQRVLSWARQNLLSAEELKPQLAQVREQQQHWGERVTRLNAKLRSTRVGDDQIAAAEEFCRSIRGTLGNLPPEKKKEFLRLVLERVWVDKQNNLEIEVIVPVTAKQPDDVICEAPLSASRERRCRCGLCILLYEHMFYSVK